jgi:hypothetical protein
LILIRQTLLALDQANKTGNYTVLRDLGSPDFQANTAAGLADGDESPGGVTRIETIRACGLSRSEVAARAKMRLVHAGAAQRE